jgi:predicted Zn-dependent protease
MYNSAVARDYPAPEPSMPVPEVGQYLFRKAMDAYSHQQYDTAARLLQEAVQADPQAADPKFFLGICLLMLGKPKEAVVPLTAFSADEPNPVVHFYLAKAYVQLSEFAKAETELRKAALSGEKRTEANSMLGQLQVLRAFQEEQAKKAVPSNQVQKPGHGH